MSQIRYRGQSIVEKATRLGDSYRTGRSWIELVGKSLPEVKFLAHYALLGNWDFIDIYEAPDEETAARVSMMAHSEGLSLVETWAAIPDRVAVGLNSRVPDHTGEDG